MIIEKTVFMIAGEPSGDILGAPLVRHLRQQNIQVAGIGGDQMIACGLTPLFPMKEISLMGIFEILPHISKLLRKINETVDQIVQLNPEVLVTIDSPGFCFRVIKRLKARGIKIPVIHYVAPSVWAWRPGRAKKLASLVDHLLCLFPFEPPYFIKEGLPTTYVGHPLLDLHLEKISPSKYRKTKNLSPSAPLVILLPGSRSGEIRLLLSIFLQALRELPGYSDFKVVLPTLPHLVDEIQTILTKYPDVPCELALDRNHSLEAMKGATVALAASGTVSLELGLLEVPMVVAYKVNPLTAFIIGRLIKTPYVSLVNILLNRPLVPELIQNECRPDILAKMMQWIMKDPNPQKAGFKELSKIMKTDTSPSEVAFREIMKYIK